VHSHASSNRTKVEGSMKSTANHPTSRRYQTPDRRGALLTLLSFAMLIVSLDQYIVVVALPELARELGYTSQTLQSVVSTYAIASSGFLLFGGRASDLLGRRRVLMFGLFLYCAASLAGGLATGPFQQLASRAVQGLGGALVFPSTLALINVRFREGEERNRALGVWAGAGASGLVIGVLLGGALTSLLGWRSVFLVNVPLALIAMGAAVALIEVDGSIDRTRAFDLPGAATITGSITLLVIALVEGPNLGWFSFWTLGLLIAGVALGVAFVVIESRSANPLLPLAMMKNAWLRLALITATLFMATFGSLLYFLSIYFQDVLRYDALQAGLGFLVPTAVVVFSSALAGRAVTRFGLRSTMITALAIGALGALGLALTLESDSSFLSLVPGLIAISIGDGAMFTALFIAASKGVPDPQQGVASGIASTGQGVGAAIGLAILVLVANAATHGFGDNQSHVATAQGIAHAVYTIAGGILLTLLIVVAFRDPSRGVQVAQSIVRSGETTK
jgi:MFS family permease